MSKITSHYQSPFYLTDPLGNNAFDYQLRGETHPDPQLRVASLLELADISQLSTALSLSPEIAFAAADEGKMKDCHGLKNFLVLRNVFRPKQSVYIFDNHNHAFYFWHLEKSAHKLSTPATLIHIDQHKDSRIPAEFLTPLEAENLDQVFTYTNQILNVGNFIPPAFKTGLLQEMILVDSEKTLQEFPEHYAHLLEPNSKRPIILDIDIDFFAPELDYIGNSQKIALIQQLLPLAQTITIATSPFFIDQTLAIQWIKKILTTL